MTCCFLKANVCCFSFRIYYQIISQEFVQFEKILNLNLPTKKKRLGDFFINFFLSIVLLK